MMRGASYAYDHLPNFREEMENFRQSINPKPQGNERDKLLLEIQSRPGGRLYKQGLEEIAS